MKVEINEQFQHEANSFFAEQGITPTDYQMQCLVETCLVLGLEQFLDAHKWIDWIKNNPNAEPEPEQVQLPKGAVCHECKKKIIIGQDLQWRCNCKIWNYDS